MNPSLLLPNKYKWIGIWITIPATVLSFFYMFFDYEIPFLSLAVKNPDAGWSNFLKNQNFTDELAVISLAIGLLFIAFSKEKYEDEFVGKVRLESLQWGVLVNAIILILCTLFIYGGTYFTVMVFNMFTPLLFFIGRFHYVMYKNNQSLTSDNTAS
jgi:hypothetical protein